MEALPDSWADIKPDIIYQTTDGLLVSFASEQVKLGIRYDNKGKHLKPTFRTSIFTTHISHEDSTF